LLLLRYNNRVKPKKEPIFMKNSYAKVIALGGMLAALAMVIMCLGGIIPIATFVCPMFCCLIEYVVLHSCGRRIAWAWYGAVAILSLLMGPDKEAAALFALLGYYPIVKPILEKSKLRFFWKMLLFNSAIAVLYLVLMRLMGLEATMAEYESLGKIGAAVMVLLGNVTFVMLDLLLTKISRKRGKRR